MYSIFTSLWKTTSISRRLVGCSPHRHVYGKQGITVASLRVSALGIFLKLLFLTTNHLRNDFYLLSLNIAALRYEALGFVAIDRYSVLKSSDAHLGVST